MFGCPEPTSCVITAFNKWIFYSSLLAHTPFLLPGCNCQLHSIRIPIQNQWSEAHGPKTGQKSGLRPLGLDRDASMTKTILREKRLWSCCIAVHTCDWTLTLAPFWTRIRITSSWPASDAMCSAVFPFCSQHAATAVLIYCLKTQVTIWYYMFLLCYSRLCTANKYIKHITSQ